MDTSRKITRLKVTTTHTIKPPMPTLLYNVSWQLSTSCCVKVVFEAQRSLLAVFFQNVLMMGAKIILFLRTHKLFTIILRTHSSDIDFLHIWFFLHFSLFYTDLLVSLQHLLGDAPPSGRSLRPRQGGFLYHTGQVRCELATISGIAITMSIKMLQFFSCFIVLIFLSSSFNYIFHSLLYVRSQSVGEMLFSQKAV